jgi:hypothetical protein
MPNSNWGAMAHYQFRGRFSVFFLESPDTKNFIMTLPKFGGRSSLILTSKAPRKLAEP